jgi:hypothetical protein
MGVSTDAILFWGITFEEGADYLDDIDDRAEEAEEEDEAREVPRPEDRGDIRSPEWEEWRGRFWAWKKEQPTVGRHCSGDYPMYYVTVGGSERRASRGSAVEVTSLEVEPGWGPKLKAYCERLGLPWSEPKWWLVSYWG